MKALVCEMCTSNDIVKQDGIYVCQNCGTKYSVEEARKMMSEGAIVIDETSKIDNYYKLAESAKEAGNNEEAEEYCNKILEIDPEHYQAWHLKGRAVGWQSTLANLRIEESVQCFSKVIDCAPEDIATEIKEEIADEISDLSIALISLCCDNFEKRPTTSNANSISNGALKTQMYAIQLMAKCGIKPTNFNGKIASKINNAVCNAWPKINKDYQGDDGHPGEYQFKTFKTACFDCIALLKAAINIDNEIPKNNIQRYQNLIMITEAVIKSCSWEKTYDAGLTYWSQRWTLSDEAREANVNNIMEYHAKIKELDPDYVIPERPSVRELTSQNGGCYVATCVYGSYDCPQVWTLRRFRDFTLAKSWYGRLFIRTYYKISPKLVKLFGNTKWFKKLWRDRLDKLIKKLKDKGYEDTAYYDR